MGTGRWKVEMKRKVWGGKGREEEKERACINEPVVQCSLFVWQYILSPLRGKKRDAAFIWF